MSAKHYNVLIIGSGSGSKITRPAAKLGFKVALIEKGPLGGTCLNRGCIPSKMLIHPADVISEIQEAKKFHISVSNPQIDRLSLINQVAEEIDAESASIAPLYAKIDNLTVYRSECTFVGPKSVSVDGQILTADKIFIVAGCKAVIPPIPGLLGTPFMTYAEALRCQNLPKSMLIIGGGYIAVELGYFYGMTGTRVEFIVRSGMLSSMDEDVRSIFQDDFCKRFPVNLNAKPIEVIHDKDGFHVLVLMSDGSKVLKHAEALFVATGVESYAKQLGLDKYGYKLDSNGFLVVDKSFKTGIDGVWGFGDVCGHPMFRHAANYQGEWVFKSVFENQALQNAGIKYPPMPQAVFSNPQLASVGPTESEARKLYGNGIIIGKCDYEDCAMGTALRADCGLVKLIFSESRHLIAGHIVGKEASTLIHMIIAYMKMNATLDDMLDTIYIHPALAEVIRNAARDANS